MNDPNFVKNHEWISFQLVGIIATAKAWPFENWTIWHPIFKKSTFKMFPDFEWLDFRSTRSFFRPWSTKKVFEYWTKGHDSNTGRHYCYHFIVFTQISCNLLALGYGGFFWFCLKSLFSVWHFLSLCPTDLSTKYQTFLCQIIECQESTDCLDYLNTGQIFKWPFKYWASFSGFFYNGDPNNGNFQIRDFSQFVNWMVH